MKLNQEKIKAILEAMVFVSPEPVTVRQMLTKIKSVLKKDFDSLVSFDEESLDSNQDAQMTSKDNSDEASLVAEDQQNAAQQNENQDEDQDQVEALEDNSEEQSLQDNSEDSPSEQEESESENQIEVTHHDIKNWLKEIAQKFSAGDCGFELVQVAKGYQLRTKYDISLYLRSEKKSLPSRLSVSAMETLSIVAYEQPVARSKIDDVRGVDSGGVLKTLLEKEFIRIVGRADEPGQPLLYGTTPKFLEVFQLKNLKDLPSLNEIQELHVGEDEDEEVSYIDSEDVIEQRMNELSESENELMQDLDESLEKVKLTEKEIEMFDQKQSTENTEQNSVS